MHSSLDTETLQVMFADSMSQAYLNNQMADMESSTTQKIQEDQKTGHAQLIKRNVARQLQSNLPATYSKSGTSPIDMGHRQIFE